MAAVQQHASSGAAAAHTTLKVKEDHTKVDSQYVKLPCAHELGRVRNTRGATNPVTSELNVTTTTGVAIAIWARGSGDWMVT